MLLFCGDSHGEFGHLIDAVEQHHPTALILLGDIQVRRSLEVELAPVLDQTEVWFIHGNHDTDTEADYQIPQFWSAFEPMISSNGAKPVWTAVHGT